MKVKNNKKRKIMITVLIVLTVLVSAGVVAYNKANDVVAETLITKIAASSAGDSASVSTAENVYQSMSDSDQAAVKEIAANHISPTTVATVTEYLANNDTAALKEYAYENLSSDEITELNALYDKYK
jgi:flagellar basal body-associated protein FliL